MGRSSSSRWLALVVTALLFVAFAGACGGDTGGPAGEAQDGGDVDASVAREADVPGPEGGAADAGRDAVAEDAGRPDAALSCGKETQCTPTGAAAYCTDTQVDKANCGACGKSCRATSSCSAGRCLACSTVFEFPGPPLVDVGTNPVAVAVGDVNGDGKPDFVVASSGSNTVSVLVNRGTGTFAPKVDYPTGVALNSVALGDVNGDGKPDLVVTHSSGSVSVLMNSGTGTFAPRVDYFIGFSPNSVALGDVDGDGKPDLVVANGNRNR